MIRRLCESNAGAVWGLHAVPDLWGEGKWISLARAPQLRGRPRHVSITHYFFNSHVGLYVYSTFVLFKYFLHEAMYQKKKIKLVFDKMCYPSRNVPGALKFYIARTFARHCSYRSTECYQLRCEIFNIRNIYVIILIKRYTCIRLIM